MTGSERSPELPDVPSMAEARLPGDQHALWSGFFVPAGTPAAIVAEFAGGPCASALADPGVQDELARRWRSTPGGPTGAEFAKRIDADIAKFGEVVKAAHLTFQ